MLGLLVEQRTFRNRAGQHLFQAHGLRTQLKAIRIRLFGCAMLVFHGVGRPGTGSPMQRHAGVRLPELDYVTCTGDAQPS